jgi:deoxycytidylate deaminase
MTKLKVNWIIHEQIYYLISIAKQSTCRRSKCGSIITNNDIIIGEGFNSMPCNEVGECFKDSLPKGFKSDKTCCVHAEQRAIMNALAKHPDLIKNSRLFFLRLDEFDEPKQSGDPYCSICSKMALDAGIGEFVLFTKDGSWTAYDTDEYNKETFKFGS